MQAWKKEVSASKPAELELVAPETYIQRKDITEVQHEKTEDRDTYTDYECMSREISVSDYNILQAIEQISTDKALEAYTLQLMEEGVL